jgi:hypothetical protein
MTTWSQPHAEGLQMVVTTTALVCIPQSSICRSHCGGINHRYLNRHIAKPDPLIPPTRRPRPTNTAPLHPPQPDRHANRRLPLRPSPHPDPTPLTPRSCPAPPPLRSHPAFNLPAINLPHPAGDRQPTAKKSPAYPPIIRLLRNEDSDDASADSANLRSKHPPPTTTLTPSLRAPPPSRYAVSSAYNLKQNSLQNCFWIPPATFSSPRTNPFL